MQNSLFKKVVTFAVIVLFIGMSITPSTGTTVVKKSTMPTPLGNILYVGGGGPGNYSKIQDAIDNASDGDTVFVYSGLYREGVITVNKSINIIGENKNTTIVDGYGHWCVFLFPYNGKDNIKLSGFTIQNAKKHNKYGTGVYIYSSHHVICGNIIQGNDYVGIRLDRSHHNHIHDNIFKNNGITVSKPSWSGGVRCLLSNYNIIEDNIFKNNSYGIQFDNGDINDISKNVIINSSKHGIRLWGTRNTIISNHIINNDNGVLLDHALKTLVANNNIYNNNKKGSFVVSGMGVIFGRNKWVNNYWGPILPRIKIISGILKILVGWDPITGEGYYKKIKWIQFDWHPAQEPYDIPMV